MMKIKQLKIQKNQEKVGRPGLEQGAQNRGNSNCYGRSKGTTRYHHRHRAICWGERTGRDGAAGGQPPHAQWSLRSKGREETPGVLSSQPQGTKLKTPPGAGWCDGGCQERWSPYLLTSIVRQVKSQNQVPKDITEWLNPTNSEADLPPEF